MILSRDPWRDVRIDTLTRQRPSNQAARASAGRIVDILQQLVTARPEMLIALEEIVRGILANLTQTWAREDEDEMRSRCRSPLPPLPLSELPAMVALLETPAAERTTKTRALRSGEKRKRR
jgi:hypothetical protein